MNIKVTCETGKITFVNLDSFEYMNGEFTGTFDCSGRVFAHHVTSLRTVTVMIIDPCPNCGEQLEFDEVDIGVGVMKGHPHCENCHWYPGVDVEVPIDDEWEDD